MKVGEAVAFQGEAWRITELQEARGGVAVAQIENLDRDAFAAVAVDRLVPMNLSTAKVEVEVDPERLRPSDVEILLGDYSKLKADTGIQIENESTFHG